MVGEQDGAAGTRLPFSLLLPVYRNDNPEHVRRALESSVQDQHRQPDQVVVVVDGPIPEQLEDALQQWAGSAQVTVDFVRLVKNVGLGEALDRGMASCTHQIVARMDADDISLPERFAQQMPLMEDGADLVGSALQEFSTDEQDRGLVRVPPLGTQQIAESARFYQPIYHPTVVFRRDVLQAAGGYRHLPGMEDYWLFARMIAAGARVENVAEPLLLYRVGSGAYARRGGKAMFRAEVQLQNKLLAERFINRRQWVRNIAVRGVYRWLPVGLRRSAYRSWTNWRRRRISAG